MQKNMKADLAYQGRKLATKGLLVQLIIGTVLLAASALFFTQWWVSLSLGLAAYMVPYTIFAYWVFRYAGGTKNNIVAQSFNQGMKLKLITTVIIFGIAFFYFNAHPLPLIGAYAMLVVVQSTAMFCLSRMS